MKKRLFRTILISLMAVFLTSFLIVVYVYGVDILSNIATLIAILVIFLVFIPLGANMLTHHIIESSMKPISSFLKYITEILLKDKYDPDMVDDQLEKEVLAYLNQYGYNSKDVGDALERVKRSESLRKEFSANVTHELKSPLTSINGYAEMIASGMTSLEEAKNFAQIINQQGNRLLRLIDETIQLSKFDNNYVRSDSFTTFSLSDLVKGQVKSLENIAQQKGLLIDLKEDDVYFYGNQKLIEDLVRNLISNAIKYSKPEGGNINVCLEEDFDNIIFTVEDEGIGISEADQARVFERFFVANKSRSGKTGTGLGLSLVKNISQMHKGKVYLVSELGKGSCFKVVLPKLTEHDYI